MVTQREKVESLTIFYGTVVRKVAEMDLTFVTCNLEFGGMGSGNNHRLKHQLSMLNKLNVELVAT